MKPQITGIAHVGVFTEDLEKSIAFYNDFLGFHTLFVTDDRANSGLYIGVIEKNDLKIELLQSTDPAVKPTETAQQSLNHFAIACTGLDELYRQLYAHGLAFETEGPRFAADFGEPPADLSILFLRGPSGERIELYEEHR